MEAIVHVCSLYAANFERQRPKTFHIRLVVEWVLVRLDGDLCGRHMGVDYQRHPPATVVRARLTHRVVLSYIVRDRCYIYIVMFLYFRIQYNLHSGYNCVPTCRGIFLS